MEERLMSKILTAAFLLFSCATCFGETSYKGLTPGESTRADAERVLGPPTQAVSKTLVEHKSPEGIGKLYVQYRDDSPTSLVERVELTCQLNDQCRSMMNKFGDLTKSVLPDALARFPFPRPNATDSAKWLTYYGGPRFIAYTNLPTDEVRVAFYSKALYESTVPRTGCTGTLLGTWDTSRGRMIVVRDGDSSVTGTFSEGNGTFRIKYRGGDAYEGEWKDATGAGVVRFWVSSTLGLTGDFKKLSEGDRALISADPARFSWRGSQSWTGNCVP
jgi:hypothetical protein